MRGEENLGEWKPRGLSLIDEHQSHLDKLERIQEVKGLLYVSMQCAHRVKQFRPGFSIPKESNEGGQD